MEFQWDFLLLEVGFLAIFVGPDRWRVLLFRLLLFRLMIESGLTKLLSHDASWINLSALTYHYQTQPLPTPVAWIAAQLPLWIHKLSTATVFLIELVLPFFMLGPRRLKQIAGVGTIGLQLLILLTGNYTYFNLLTIGLCLFLFDDECLAQLRIRPSYRTTPGRPANRQVTIVLSTVIALVSSAEIWGMFARTPPLVDSILRAQASFGIVNRYGLFAVMTTTRSEIEIEGSMDGDTWLPYVFPHKPGPLGRAPTWIAPFQPRLDWQMWFASLGTARENPWFTQLLVRLLEGSKPVLALFERAPFGGAPPKYIRAMRYRYRFTTADEHRRTGNWWFRESDGTYFPPASLGR